jgi:bifunctional non-homologous end joining protein LigD
VWDRGTYSTEQELSDQLQTRKITVTLSCQKLKGKYLLFKSKREGVEDNQWLLIKANDQYASAEDLTVTRPESVLSRITNEDLKTKKLKRNNPKLLKQKRKIELQQTTYDIRILLSEQMDQI